ncbi:MAG TPA: hypothetical protein ENN73_00290 [Firmicutes bacterium]|nr:hypothetical protein [Bacillota bacterium]
MKYVFKSDMKPYYNFYPKTPGNGLVIEFSNTLNETGLTALETDYDIVKSASVTSVGDNTVMTFDFGFDSEYQIYPVGNDIVLSVKQKVTAPTPVVDTTYTPPYTPYTSPIYTTPAPAPVVYEYYVEPTPTTPEYTGYRVPPETEVSKLDIESRGQDYISYSELQIKQEDLSGRDITTVKKQYRGMTPISMELEGADIKNFLRLISYKTNISIYSDPGVSGTVNIKLKDVPWEVALDNILKNAGFTYEWQGDSMIRVTKLEILEQEKKLELESTKMKEDSEPLITRIYTVSYADPDSVRNLIQEQLTKRGTVDINRRANKVIVTDVAKSFAKVEALISDLDLETKQVNISTRIYRLNDITSKDLGIYWTGGNTVNPYADPQIDVRSNLGPNSPVPGIGQVVIASANQMMNIEAIISSYASMNSLELVTSPNVTTLNHNPASIVIGQMVPITMLDAAGNTVTQLTTIGTKIVVTPHINAEGMIIMNIHPEISALAGTTGEINIATSEADTKVMVRDGETAILGGLTEIRKTESKNFVPGLHKIPVIGLLTKNSSKNIATAEILIFVTPRIVRL